MTSASLNALLAALTSFAKETPSVSGAGIDWGELMALAEGHGLAAILSYQLDYRFLARLRPPPEARERLAQSFNAAVNDNVLKVTHLRRLLSGDGMPEVVILGAAGWIDGLYPHVAFREIGDIDLWATDLPAASAALAEGGLATHAPGEASKTRSLAARLANPDIALRLWRAPAGLRLDPRHAAQLWIEKLPVRAYGPAARRLAPADAVVAHVGALALQGFAVPRIQLVDLREMILRVDRPDGFYGSGSPELRAPSLLERARELGLSRALWAAIQLVSELFPEVAAAASQLAVDLPSRTTRIIEETVVRPALDPRRIRVTRAATALRRVLLT